MSKNVGEYDELRMKLRLIEMRDKGESLVIGGKVIKIQSVKMDSEFGKMPEGVDIRKLSDFEVEGLADKLGAGKSRGVNKADVLINGIGYSLKSHRSMPPAIVNHTPRFGWLRICKYLEISIDELDRMVEEYFNKRDAKILKEDVCNDNPLSPFKDHKEYLRPLLNYFLFIGSGARESKYPAKYVMDCKDPHDTKTWVLHDENDYLDIYWDKLVFSMRNKGFEGYPYGNKEKSEICKPWAKRFEGSLKGSLHVRVK